MKLYVLEPYIDLQRLINNSKELRDMLLVREASLPPVILHALRSDKETVQTVKAVFNTAEVLYYAEESLCTIPSHAMASNINIVLLPREKAFSLLSNEFEMQEDCHYIDITEE